MLVWDVLLIIFNFCDSLSRVRLIQVCKKFNKLKNTVGKNLNSEYIVTNNLYLEAKYINFWDGGVNGHHVRSISKPMCRLFLTKTYKPSSVHVRIMNNSVSIDQFTPDLTINHLYISMLFENYRITKCIIIYIITNKYIYSEGSLLRMFIDYNKTKDIEYLYYYIRFFLDNPIFSKTKLNTDLKIREFIMESGLKLN